MTEPRSRMTIGSLMVLVALAAFAIAYRDPLWVMIRTFVGIVALVAFLALSFIGVASIPIVILSFFISSGPARPPSGPSQPEGRP